MFVSPAPGLPGKLHPNFHPGQNDLTRLRSLGSITALSMHCTSILLATNLTDTVQTKNKSNNVGSPPGVPAINFILIPNSRCLGIPQACPREAYCPFSCVFRLRERQLWSPLRVTSLLRWQPGSDEGLTCPPVLPSAVPSRPLALEGHCQDQNLDLQLLLPLPLEGKSIYLSRI